MKIAALFDSKAIEYGKLKSSRRCFNMYIKWAILYWVKNLKGEKNNTVLLVVWLWDFGFLNTILPLDYWFYIDVDNIYDYSG